MTRFKYQKGPIHAPKAAHSSPEGSDFCNKPEVWLRVLGSGFRALALGFRVQSLEFRVGLFQGSGFRGQGLGLRVQGLGLVWGLGLS